MEFYQCHYVIGEKFATSAIAIQDRSYGHLFSAPYWNGSKSFLSGTGRHGDSFN